MRKLLTLTTVIVALGFGLTCYAQEPPPEPVEHEAAPEQTPDTELPVDVEPEGDTESAGDVVTDEPAEDAGDEGEPVSEDAGGDEPEQDAGEGDVEADTGDGDTEGAVEDAEPDAEPMTLARAYAELTNAINAASTRGAAVGSTADNLQAARQALADAEAAHAEAMSDQGDAAADIETAATALRDFLTATFLTPAGQ